jgi:hypothetical protein
MQDNMKRRQVITGLFAVAAASVFPYAQRFGSKETESTEDMPLSVLHPVVDIDPPLFDPISDHENRFHHIPTHQPVEELADPVAVVSTPVKAVHGVNKNIDFARDYDDDIFITTEDKVLLHSVHLRLKKLQSTVGYGNFNILSFDEALTFAKRFSEVGEFIPAELQFIEKVFAYNAAEYGFFGEKVESSLTASITKSSTFKVPNTGHYLFKEQSFAYYEKIRQSIGEGIVLTSGIRSNVKQLHLFLAKVVSVKGNLSRASRSLAPPGYSYHGIGDFDVGRKGWGGRNFTNAFSETDEFKRMQDLGYVAIRYDEDNTLGVRYEPWHIKVV